MSGILVLVLFRHLILIRNVTHDMYNFRKILPLLSLFLTQKIPHILFPRISQFIVSISLMPQLRPSLFNQKLHCNEHLEKIKRLPQKASYVRQVEILVLSILLAKKALQPIDIFGILEMVRHMKEKIPQNMLFLSESTASNLLYFERETPLLILIL